MRALVFAAVMTLAIVGPLRAQRTDQELDRVSAFARLYGVVRYFYPSDAAASLDWNRFVVHGVARVRAAENPKAFETTLNSLFAPLGPGITIGPVLPPASGDDRSPGPLVAWRYLGPGFTARRGPSPYKAKRTNRSESTSTSIDGFVTIMQTIPAEPLRGKAVRLRGQARVKGADATGAGAFWLRVDRPDRTMGFFDNMGDRPIREPEWREYSIEGVVAEDAANVAFGVMASGSATADFDAVEISTRDAGGAWTPVQIADAGFEAATDARTGGWVRAGTSQTAVITRSSGEAPEGRQFVRLAPGGSGSGSTAELFAAPLSAGAHVDVALGSGLNARVPLVLSDSEATTDAARSRSLDALIAAMAQDHNPGNGFEIDLRLADVVVAWNVFRHFYPYWTEASVDWDARLRPQLDDALRATTREGQRNALRRLVADARDGHGGVSDPRQANRPARLPIQLAVVENRVAITASDVPAEAPVGDVVATIDGVSAVQRLDERIRLASGTPQWRQARAVREMVMCAKGTIITLGLETAAGTRQAALHCDAAAPAMEKRPGPVVEMQPGIWYVDLTRANNAQVSPVLDQIARATGVVFDVRGYPTDAGAAILPHLIDAPEQDRWMHVAKITGPSGQSAGWESFGWNLAPREPRIRGKIVFLTDGRAISYAESVMGYVGDRKLGTIVGSATAGTNGNVAVFDVPSGFQISFTGMRVTRHDGQSPHHLIGVTPTIAVSPTLASLREGRDLVLERALEVIRGK